MFTDFCALNYIFSTGLELPVSHDSVNFVTFIGFLCDKASE